MPSQHARQVGTVRLRVRGRLTISRARRLHGDLLAAFRRGRTVTLEISGATEADLSFLQLVCAARRSAAVRGIEFAVVAKELPDEVCQLVAAVGADGGPGDPAAVAEAGVPRSS